MAAGVATDYIAQKGAVVAIANGIGPVIGGALASASKNGWRNIFRLNLPLTALTTLCVVFFMPLKKVEGDWRLYVYSIMFNGNYYTDSKLGQETQGHRLIWHLSGIRRYSSIPVRTYMGWSVLSMEFRPCHRNDSCGRRLKHCLCVVAVEGRQIPVDTS